MNSKEMAFLWSARGSPLSQCPVCNHTGGECSFIWRKCEIHLLCRSNSVAEDKYNYVEAYVAAVSHICNSCILKSSTL